MRDHLAARGRSAPRSVRPAQTEPPPFAALADLDAHRYRDVLGRFVTTVVAITGLTGDGEPVGMLVESFGAVSVDPPMVSFSVPQTSPYWPRLRAADRFCANLIGETQRHVSASFSSARDDAVTGLSGSRSPGHPPIIDGTPAWLECSIRAEHETGHRLLVVADVHRAERCHDGWPLISFRGIHGRFHPC